MAYINQRVYVPPLRAFVLTTIENLTFNTLCDYCENTYLRPKFVILRMKELRMDPSSVRHIASLHLLTLLVMLTVCRQRRICCGLPHDCNKSREEIKAVLVWHWLCSIR